MELLTEEKLILLLSRLNPSSEVMEQAKNLLNDKSHSIDYPGLLKLALSNEVAPILYKNLNGLNVIPDDVQDRFRNAYLHTTKNNILNSREMVNVLTLLRNKSIEAVPLKGSFASDVVFGNLGYYPATDIDILVKPSDIRLSEDILSGAGYTRNIGISEDDLLSSHYHFIYQKGGHTVEVHWNLVKRYFDIPPDFWWEDMRKIEHEGIEATMLSIERYIMYLVFRLFDHGFRPLKFFVLISEIVNKYSKEIDWDKLFLFSKEYRMERLVSFTLKLLNNMFDTKMPDDIIERRTAGYNVFKKLIVKGLFQDVKRPHLRMLLYTFLLDSPFDLTKVISKRFFPNAGEIRLRYGLPESSKKIYAYYILNPFLILIKKKHYN